MMQGSELRSICNSEVVATDSAKPKHQGIAGEALRLFVLSTLVRFPVCLSLAISSAHIQL